MSLVVKYGENKTVPEGVYVVKLTKLEQTSHPQWGDSIRWTFEIIDGPEAGVSVTAMSSTKVSPKSKIFSWAQAFNVKLEPGTEFDLEDLIGKVVRAKVVHKKQTKNVDGKSVELTFSNVQALAPYKGNAQQVQTSETPESNQDQDQEFSNTMSSDDLDEDQDFDF